MMGRPRRSPLFPYTPLSRPPGCVFAPRCEFRRAICVENEPPLFPVPERGGVSRCYFVADVLGAGGNKRIPHPLMTPGADRTVSQSLLAGDSAKKTFRAGGSP